MDPRNDNHPLISLGLECHNADLHSSNVELGEDCPRKFLLSERFHLRTKGEYRSALELGSHFHHIEEWLIKGAPFDEALSRAAEKRVAFYEELSKEADELGLLPGGKSIDKVAQDMQQDFDKAAAMARWMFVNRPWPDNGTDIEDWEAIGTEIKLRAKFPDLAPWVRGALDCVMRNTKTGEVWIVDHKTTSWDPTMVMATYKFSIQPRLYIKLLEALLPDDQKVTGVCHNVIQKPTIRLKKNQTWEAYLEEIGEWYAASLGSSVRFARSWLMFGSSESWDDETRYRVSEAAKLCTCRPDLARFPKHSQNCMKYNSLCGYYYLCSADPITWGTVIEQHYEVGHRDDDTEGLQELGGSDD